MKKFAAGVLAVVAVLATTTLQAAIVYDDDVTPDVIFGSGNDNVAFTVDRAGGVELGLRAKLRFDSANQPQNIFNSNGDGTYTFNDGLPPIGFGFAPNSTSTATWNFEWSINSNFDGSSGFALDDLTYELGIDFDPGPGTLYQTFDPINTAFADHAIGTNATGNGGGTTAADATQYASLISTDNVAQNSWNMEFFDSPSFPFNGAITGQYEIYLAAFSGGNEVARTNITVNVVPEPSSVVLLGIGMVGLAGYGLRRRKQRQAAV